MAASAAHAIAKITATIAAPGSGARLITSHANINSAAVSIGPSGTPSINPPRMRPVYAILWRQMRSSFHPVDWVIVAVYLLVMAGVGVYFSRRQTNLQRDRKSTRLNSSHSQISYAVFCLKKKKKKNTYCDRQTSMIVIHDHIS